MKFLVCYSTVSRAQDAGLPKVGTVIDLTTFTDLLMFQALVVHPIIIHPEEYRPSCIYDYDEALNRWYDYTEGEDDHLVETLPENFRTYRWIEVYNSYRE